MEKIIILVAIIKICFLTRCKFYSHQQKLWNLLGSMTSFLESSLLLQHDCYFPSFLSSKSIPLPPLLPIRHPLLLFFYSELGRLLIDINQTWRWTRVPSWRMRIIKKLKRSQRQPLLPLLEVLHEAQTTEL